MVSILLVALAFAITHPAETQSTVPGSAAFLLEQPQWRSGIPVLPANRTGHYRARYDLDDTIIEVYVAPRAQSASTASVTDAVTWQPFFCPVVPLDRLTTGRSAEVQTVRAARNGYTVFVVVPVGFVSTCDVVAAFVTTFEFFLDLQGLDLASDDDPSAVRAPFPAVLDIAG